MLTRRSLASGALAMATLGAAAPATREKVVILAPSNLGLRPDGSRQPGAWQAPEVLMAAGFSGRIGARRVESLPRPPYSFAPQPGTRLRNGPALREFSLALAKPVQAALKTGQFPVVLGGDCGNLLGCLYGLRRAGGQGLVHVDGHSDFVHPRPGGPDQPQWSAAGMDLALATGRGETLLTQWPGVSGPLVRDEDAIQLGERDSFDPEFDHSYGELRQTAITRVIVQDMLKMGIDAAAKLAVDRLAAQKLTRAWLHVDLDVLDQNVMPAVDSPGSPGLNFAQLGALLATLLRSGRIAGMDVAIYDPERDPERKYATPIVETIAKALAVVV